MIVKNMLLFLAWCRRNVHCDECESLGAVSIRTGGFLCTECCRLLHSSG